MSTVGVLGGGSWGVALARAAVRAGGEVTLHSRRQHGDAARKMRVTSSLEQLAESRLILVAVPSHQVRMVARELGDHLDGSHLLLVPPGDTDALVAATVRVRDDGFLRARLESGARALASDFTWDRIAARTVDFFAEVLG